MEEDVKGLKDYVDIIWRRKYWAIVPAVILACISLAVVYSLSATYKSQGTILIESQEIPTDLVKSTVTSYADQRIEVIKQRLMTTSKVMEMVNKYNLYAKERQRSPSTSSIVALFRDNTHVELVQANVTDPVSGRAKRASIAFTVSFMDKSPQIAQQVANELVTEFLKENVKARTDRAADTKEFLKEEGDRFQKRVQQLERQIAEFKQRYSGSLPELLQYNLTMIERLEDELKSNQNEILVLKDQITTMSLELANQPAYLPTTLGNTSAANQPSSSEALLASLRTEYNALLGKYEPSHPDVVRLKRQISGLEAELGITSSDNESVQLALDEATAELNTLKQKYADDHPDVKALTNKIAGLEDQVTKGDGATVSAVNESRFNPIHLQLKSQISSAEREADRLANRQLEVRARLADFEKRVAETHQVELAYEELSRDHTNTLAKYRELRAKQLEAELAQNLESENKGESFTLIEPPMVPSEAEKPNRPKLMVMGLAASTGAGMGLALLIEMLFGGVRGFNQISHAVGRAPLVVIPMIETTKEIARKKAIRNRWIILALLSVIAGIAAVHFYVMNLEVLWFKVMRKIGSL